jgi:hypothetical protein
MGVGGSSGPPTGWKKQIGTLAHISAGDDGEIWGLTAQQQIRRWNDGEWQPVPGSLKQISVGSIDNLWGVNEADQIFRWFGDWQEMPGRLRWVSAAADGTVVGVAGNDDIFRWNGGGWEQLAGKLARISVASRKEIYGSNRAQQIFRWNGGGWDLRAGSSVGTLSAAIQGGVPHVWALLDTGALKAGLYQCVNNGAWEPRDGMLTQISVAANFVLGVNHLGEVYSWGHALPTVNRPLVTRQRGWRWCSKCQALFYGEHAGRGNCASKPHGSMVTAVTPHDPSGSSEYALATAHGAPGQANWRWCRKCAGLFFAGGAGGRCASGHAHDGSQSGSYTVLHNDANARGQESWRWCRKCEGLFFAGGGATQCPSGAAHDGTGSGAYKVLQIG